MIHMRSTIGKVVCAIALTGCVLSAQGAREVRIDGLPEPVRVLSVDSFEGTLPGQLPKGWSISGEKPGDMRPLSRYVTNARSCSGRKSLAYDFSELPPGVGAGTASHGYTNRRLEPVKDGWWVLSFSFRQESGKLAVEMRGPHKGGSRYQTFGVEIGHRYSGTTVIWTSACGPRVSAGAFRPGTWHRLTLCMPSPGAQKAHAGGEPLCSYARLDVRSPAGGWTLGEWRSAPVGAVEITGPLTHFDFLGYGRSRFFFDNVVWGATASPPTSDVRVRPY